MPGSGRSAGSAVVVVWHLAETTPEIDSIRLEHGSGIRRMRVLPLLVVPADHPRALDPPPPAVIALHHREDDLRVVNGIDIFLDQAAWFMQAGDSGPNAVERGFPAALNLSLQFAPKAPLAPDSVIGIATKVAARYLPVVVAVGNMGLARDGRDLFDLRSPLARLPWVTSVGATVDEEGSELTASSSVGRIGGAGPSVVAHGQNRFVPEQNESSFATPKVTGMAAVVTAFLLHLRSVVFTMQTGVARDVPLVWLPFIDRGFKDFRVEQDVVATSIPAGIGLSQDRCEGAVRAMARYALGLQVTPHPEFVTALLLRAVRPGPGRPHESGAGTLSRASVLAMLASLTWRELFGVAGVELPPEPEFDVAPAEEGELSDLWDVTLGSRLLSGYDVGAARIAGATLSPPA